jgi:uncharacterized membrane protein YeaQ/YmgE (transglycosylase-associated protein family)
MKMRLVFVTAAVCICSAVTASARLGETVPQLINRFGKSYAIDSVEGGNTYKFESEKVRVDVLVSNNISVAETYFSDHALTANGEPPNDIVRAVLKTNDPQARWLEIDARPFRADYALRSSNQKYVAFLRYKGQQPKGFTWTMTVSAAKALSSSSSPAATTGLTEQTPLPTARPTTTAIAILASTETAADAPTTRQMVDEAIKRGDEWDKDKQRESSVATRTGTDGFGPHSVIWTLLVGFVIGAIAKLLIGAVAKLLTPAKDSARIFGSPPVPHSDAAQMMNRVRRVGQVTDTCIGTMLLGIAGALVGTWMGRVFWGENYVAGWIMSVFGAMILYLLYVLYRRANEVKEMVYAAVRRAF